jgi:hypothetical protein
VDHQSVVLADVRFGAHCRLKPDIARELELTWIKLACLLACADAAPISKEFPMRILALAILAAGMVLAAGPARAQTYDPAFPVCMHVITMEAQYEDCTYVTLAQCAMSASGRAAQCNINPFYAGAAASLGRNDRRYRRVY